MYNLLASFPGHSTSMPVFDCLASIFAYCKQSNTGGGNGRGVKLLISKEESSSKYFLGKMHLVLISNATGGKNASRLNFKVKNVPISFGRMSMDH